MEAKYNIGEMVKVYEYYAEGDIVRDVYYGLIVDTTAHRFEGGCHFIYHILPNNENNTKNKTIQTAEEFAVERLEI